MIIFWYFLTFYYYIAYLSYHLTDSDTNTQTKLQWIQGKKYFLKGPKENFQFHIVREFVSQITLDVGSGYIKETNFSSSGGFGSGATSVTKSNEVKSF